MTLEVWIQAAGIVAASAFGAYVIAGLLDWVFGE